MHFLDRFYGKASPVKYSDLASDSQEELLASDEETSHDEKRAFQTKQRWQSERRFMLFGTAVNLMILAATIVLVTGFRNNIGDGNACVIQTSSYSPLYNKIPIELTTWKLNGTLFPGTDPSWLRQPPGTPRTERNWESFEYMTPFPITRDDVKALGKDPETAARFPEEFGYGSDAYIGSLDVQHKLHCLNELRKMAFFDYGNGDPQKQAHGKLWWIHLRHCMDMVAQDMICHADADIVTYEWKDTQPSPFPDFSLNRKCRDIHALFHWRDDNGADYDLYSNIKKPKSGIKQVPMDREYYSVYGFEDSDLFPNGEGFGPLPEIDRFFGLPPTKEP